MNPNMRNIRNNISYIIATKVITNRVIIPLNVKYKSNARLAGLLLRYCDCT